MKTTEKRNTRVDRIAKKLVKRYKSSSKYQSKTKKPMKRRETQSRERKMIAYDLETTNIKAGTPTPLYVTAFGENFQVSKPLKDGFKSLANIIINEFLTEENNRARFIAWNGNNYDIYFIARALLVDTDYIIQPYLTRSKSLRGCKIVHKDNDKLYWEFLDGISMTGLIGRKLEFFLKTFAPDYQKLDAPNWERETFNPKNPEHVKYADRDSEGLYYGMKAVQEITMENFGLQLQPTIGNLGIKAFVRNMPHQVQVWEPVKRVVDAVRQQAMRGGYCHCNKRYHGPVWKYDLNQAYAAAMRDTPLPAGRCHHVANGADWRIPGIVRITASKADNVIPFYYREMDGKAKFATTVINDTWITTAELKQLIAENWNVEISESYYWEDSFTMIDYVFKLETLRINAPDGVNGATGLIIKSIGNNSYGKTLEEIGGLALVMSLEQPPGYSEYFSEDDNLQFVWFKFQEPLMREYHQPQIGAMITAHVRMEVRRAALLNPQAWLYADTDCVIFSEAVNLNTHPKLYGRWKEECAGDVYYIIEKKVYADAQAKTKHAKGMNVNRLNLLDFQEWYYGRPPKQVQTHKNNFVKFVTGSDMFHEHTKVGQQVAKIASLA